MLDCPKCRAPLPLFQEAACRKCGADLGVSFTTAAEARADRAAADRDRAGRSAIVISVVIYAILMITTLDGKVQAKAAQAFGDEPLGLPLSAFVGGLLTIVYVPMPFAFYHLVLIATRARHDGHGFRGLWALLYLADVHHRHPELARSRWICLLSLGYYLVVVAAWIVYTALLGI